MSRRTVKIIVMIIVIAMLATTLFSFVFFLPTATRVYGLETRVMTDDDQRFLTEQMRELERFIRHIQANFKDEISFDVLTQGAFDGALHALGDPHSGFFVDEAGDAFLENLMGEFGGIGVTLRANAQGQVEVVDVVTGAPAERAGIIRGDIIIRVSGNDVTSSSVLEVSQMLRGAEGTNVSVTVRRSGETRNFTIIREIIRVSSVTYEMLENNIGYIRISMFDFHVAREFQDAVTSLKEKGAESLILDLRNNIGGFLDPAIDIADKFVQSGNIVHLAKRGEIVETVRATNRETIGLETVLLINEYSASSSEIVAAALRDHNVATLVGTTTYGKGSVQTLANAHDGRAYTLSIYYFLTPNRRAINNVGVAPHHVVRNSLGENRAAALELYRMFAPFVEDVRAWPGDSGLNVFAAQQRLLLLGYTPGLTGVMDDATVNAVREFQRDQGLYVYGVLDFTTMRRIREVTTAHVLNDSAEDLQLNRAIELLR